MKKQEQQIINEYVIANYNLLKHNLQEYQKHNSIKFKQLRSCSASVFETDRYYVLKSYSTIVAFIDKQTGELFDILRYVYGYTTTSAKHISKFAHDYPCTCRQTYKG